MKQPNEQNQQIEILMFRVDTLSDMIQRLLDKESIIPHFCTLKKAAELKGVTEYKNLQKLKRQQPCCGTSYEIVNGKRCWNREQIIEWLSITDESLPEYQSRF